MFPVPVFQAGFASKVNEWSFLFVCLFQIGWFLQSQNCIYLFINIIIIFLSMFIHLHFVQRHNLYFNKGSYIYSVLTIPHKQARIIGVVSKHHKCYMLLIYYDISLKILLLLDRTTTQYTLLSNLHFSFTWLQK